MGRGRVLEFEVCGFKERTGRIMTGNEIRINQVRAGLETPTLRLQTSSFERSEQW